MSAETPELPPLLTASGLTLSRGGRTLFSALELELRPGAALVVRGPNGAGKSSLLLALAGILRPDAGRVSFAPAAPPSPTLPARGRVPAGDTGSALPQSREDEPGPPQATSPLAGEDGRGGATRTEENDRPHIHLLAHATGLKSRLTVGENLGFWRTLNGAGGASVADALAVVGLGGLEAASAGHLSAGQSKRLALARLLVNRRPLWLLDEPTGALDAEGQALLGALIAAHLRDGGGVIVATHDEIAALANAPTLTLGAT